jgi:hypothetical protein
VTAFRNRGGHVTQVVSEQVKTITEMLAEQPDVDVRETWTALWDTLTGIKDRITAEFAVERHPSSAPYEYYETGGFEGSLNTYSGPELEWFVHSWIGNRQASILDMNITVWLGQHVDAPHLCLVFGTVPQLFHYSDLIARRDLTVDSDYLDRYYEPENAAFLAFRGDPRFTPNVSHGSYMRAVASPICHSAMTERTPASVAAVCEQAVARFESWLAMVRNAPEVPLEERAALRERDHQLRRLCYERDPMNVLAARAMGEETAAAMVQLRLGDDQMAGR